MALKHANPGDVIDVRPLGDQLESSRTTTLVKTDTLEIIRLVLPAGKNIPEHQAPGLLTVQCLEGRVAFTAAGNEIDLEPGRLIHLNEQEPHAVRAVEASSLLLTLYSPQS
jgi:quercetin dioxygenase-like cupin family protein